jgi:hypothetical protein
VRQKLKELRSLFISNANPKPSKKRKKKNKTVPPLDFAWATRVSLRLSAHLTPKLGVSDLNKQISSKKKKKKKFPLPFS